MKLTRDKLKQIIKEELEEMISDKGTTMDLGGPLGGSVKSPEEKARAQLANLGLKGPLNIGGQQFAFMVSPQDPSVLKLYDYRSAAVGAKTYEKDVSIKDPEVANALRQIRESKKK
jgi:hypothetical protein